MRKNERLHNLPFIPFIELLPFVGKHENAIIIVVVMFACYIMKYSLKMMGYA